jgi:hypothetical protein
LLLKYLKKTQGSITKETYIKMMEQLGKPIDPDKIPLGFEDLPTDAQVAVNIYNRLGNRVESNIGFVGKDYSNLPLLIEVYNIVDKEFLLDLLLTMEVHYIESNAAEVKKLTSKYKTP